MGAAYNSNVAGNVAGNRQNLAYIGANNRIYVLDFNQTGGGNPWSQWDLIAFQERYNQPIPYPVPGADSPRGGAPIAVFPWEPAGVNNAFAYIGSVDGQPVIEAVTLSMPGLQVPNAFNLTHITNTSGAPPRPDSPVVGYTWKNQQSVHLVYIDSQSHVIELYRVGSGQWYSNDLTARTGFTGIYAPRAGSPLAAYAFENQGTEHVMYIAQDGTIRELYYSGQWFGNNLSSSVPAALPPSSNSPLAAYAAEYENTQHVIYFNTAGNVQELYYSGGRWQTGTPLDITAGAAKPAANSAVAGYTAEYESTEHVVYVDSYNILHELYHSGSGWRETLLLQSAGNPTPPRAETPLAGYAYLYSGVGTQHILYIDTDDNLHELYREGSAWYSGVVSGSIAVSSAVKKAGAR